MLDVNGSLYCSQVLDFKQGFLYLATLKRNGVMAKLNINQPVYLMQENDDGGLLYILLRFTQHNFKGTPSDIFRVVRSTAQIAAGEAFKIAYSGWCELTVFKIFNREREEFTGKVQMFELSESGVGLILRKALPPDTFAECEFTLGNKIFKLPSRATYGISSDNGAYHRMQFEFVHISKKETKAIREFLFSEQARRLREG